MHNLVYHPHPIKPHPAPLASVVHTTTLQWDIHNKLMMVNIHSILTCQQPSDFFSPKEKRVRWLPCTDIALFCCQTLVRASSKGSRRPISFIVMVGTHHVHAPSNSNIYARSVYHTHAACKHTGLTKSESSPIAHR